MYHIFILNIYILRNNDKIDGPSQLSIRWIIVSYVVQSIPFLFYLSSIIDPVKGYRFPVFWFWDFIKVNNWFWCGCRWIGLIGFHVVGVDLGSICHRQTEWDPFFFHFDCCCSFWRDFCRYYIFRNKKNNLFSAHWSIEHKNALFHSLETVLMKEGEKIFILM